MCGAISTLTGKRLTSFGEGDAMKRSTAVILSMLLALSGCEILKEGPAAVAQLDAPRGSAVWGSVSFVEIGGKVTVRADVRGLRPGAQFGFHIHEKSDCSAPGEHFNPTGKPHGHYRVAERHAGDLINLQSDAEGNAVYAFETNLLTVTAGPTSVIGRTIVIHADPDDYRTQPAGNSGDAIACGLIRVVR
jgi:Cu-Zn family superoxide dismutase